MSSYDLFYLSIEDDTHTRGQEVIAYDGERILARGREAAEVLDAAMQLIGELDAGAKEFSDWFEEGWGASVPYFIASLADDKPVHSPVPSPVPEPPLSPSDIAAVMRKRRSSFGPFPTRSVDGDQFYALLRHIGRLLSGRSRLGAGRRVSLISGFTTYVLTQRVEGFSRSWRVIDWESLGMRLIGDAPSPTELKSAQCGQSAWSSCAAAFLLAANYREYQKTNASERGLQEVFTDAGRVANAIVLAATMAKLKTHISPAFNDSMVNQFLGLDGVRHGVLHSVSIG